MFWKRKKKKERKMAVNTDGDMLPVDIVKETQRMAETVGRAATKEARKDPSFMRVLQRGMDTRGQPGPEDVFLLYLYGKGAISPEKAIRIPKDAESETHIYILWADNLVQHTLGDRIFVTQLGVQRLRALGVVDGKGKILQSL